MPFCDPFADISAHHSNKRCPRNFGTISIILPSEFTGGQLDLSDQGQVKEVDFAQNSILSTSVLGSYTGLTHNLKPVRSGYKILLCYNLIHASDAICPSLPDMHGPIDKLRHILLCWKQAINRPEKLAYVLKCCYSKSDLSMDVLAGPDARNLSYLLPVARALHFRIYLANIQLRIWGDVHHGYETRREERYQEYEWEDQLNPPSEDEREIDPDELELDEDVNEEIDVEHVVDLDGMPVRIPNLAIERKEHLVGDAALDEPMSAKPDETKYAEHDGDVRYSVFVLHDGS